MQRTLQKYLFVSNKPASRFFLTNNWRSNNHSLSRQAKYLILVFSPRYPLRDLPKCERKNATGKRTLYLPAIFFEIRLSFFEHCWISVKWKIDSESGECYQAQQARYSMRRDARRFPLAGAELKASERKLVKVALSPRTFSQGLRTETKMASVNETLSRGLW